MALNSAQEQNVIPKNQQTHISDDDDQMCLPDKFKTCKSAVKTDMPLTCNNTVAGVETRSQKRQKAFKPLKVISSDN